MKVGGGEKKGIEGVKGSNREKEIYIYLSSPRSIAILVLGVIVVKLKLKKMY